MLVAGCLHHLEALLNHLTANFVALSSTEEEKTLIHSSRAVEPYGRVSLYRVVFFKKSILSSSILYKKQLLSVV